MSQATMTEIFGEVISVYTRAQAIEDGVLADMNAIEEVKEVTEQHFSIPVAVTSSVWGMIEKAVENKKHCNDLKGVWHDLCWMSKVYRGGKTNYLFPCIITGVGRKRNHTFKAVYGHGDNGELTLTIMLPNED